MAFTLMHSGLESVADRFGARDAVLAGDDRWSFVELDRFANGYAQHLRGVGVAPGDRVAVMMRNRIEFLVAVHAISKLGAAAVLVSPAWKDLEVRHALEVTTPVHGVADGASVELLGRYLPVTDVDAQPLVECVDLVHAVISDDADAVLVFSSGTTGLPKAVRHTHRSIVAGTRHWVNALGLGPDDRFQVATPPSHILGLLNLLAAASAGTAVRLHTRFDLDESLRRIESDRMTLEMAVAPIALAMANHPNLEAYDLTSLRFILWGATPVTRSVAETVTARTGVGWLQGYGASELPVIACNPVHDPDAWRLDSAGLPPDGVELRVVDLDTGVAVDAGAIGEIQARSPSVMAGYLPAEATDDAFIDGWYRTGDVGWLDRDGWIHLTDRAKEMIKVNAFQVAPAEIEAVLHGHPAVLDCAVFGVPDERAGELPVAAVQLDPDRSVADGELEHLVADALATYKHLHQVVVVDAIPRLPSGKALRRDLRERFLQADR